MEPITVSFRTDVEDALALSMEFYRTSATVQRQCRIAQLTLAAASAIFAVTAYRGDPRVFALNLGIAVLIGLMVFLYPKWHMRWLRKTAQRLLSEPGNRQRIGDCSLTLTDEGLKVSSPIGKAEIAWAAVSQVLLTPERLIVIVAGLSGVVIPSSDVPMETLLELKRSIEQHTNVAVAA